MAAQHQHTAGSGATTYFKHGIGSTGSQSGVRRPSGSRGSPAKIGLSPINPSGTKLGHSITLRCSLCEIY